MRKRLLSVLFTEDEIHGLCQVVADGYLSNIYAAALDDLVEKIRDEWPELFPEYGDE